MRMAGEWIFDPARPGIRHRTGAAWKGRPPTGRDMAGERLKTPASLILPQYVQLIKWFAIGSASIS